jgi:hypothetical protein
MPTESLTLEVPTHLDRADRPLFGRTTRELLVLTGGLFTDGVQAAHQRLPALAAAQEVVERGAADAPGLADFQSGQASLPAPTVDGEERTGQRSIPPGRVAPHLMRRRGARISYADGR